MRVLVCGSRTFEDKRAIKEFMFGIYKSEMDRFGEFCLVHGAAPGADSLAAEVARDFVCIIEAYPADWDRYGRAAGSIRNQQMLLDGKPDRVLAFVDKPLAESRGTHNMVTIARKAGVPVYVVEKVQ